MEKRLITFFLATALTLLVYGQLIRWMNPVPVQPDIAEQGEKEIEAGAPAGNEKNQVDKEPKGADAPHDVKPATVEAPETRFVLGSLDPGSPYQMLVTLSSRGASIERIELNNRRYKQTDDASGYLGHLALTDDPSSNGCVVNVVGDGTPANLATAMDGTTVGLQPGDIISEFDGEKLSGTKDYLLRIKATKPKDTVVLGIKRSTNGKDQDLEFEITLTQPPLQVIRPEPEIETEDHPQHQLSYLLTLSQIGNDAVRLGKDEYDELPSLFNANWEAKVVENAVQPTVEFSYILGNESLSKLGVEGNIEIIKRYSLAKLENEFANENEKRHQPAYHLDFEIEIRNLGEETVKFAYRIDGPTGLPLEGSWYAYKTHPSSFGAAGLRDVVARRFDRPHQMFTNAKIIKQAKNPDSPDYPLFDDSGSGYVDIEYVGVDARYFVSALIPKQTNDHPPVDFKAIGRLVGPVIKERQSKTDLSFRMDSREMDLKAGASHFQKFEIFAGPKSPEVLAAYGLEDCICYGWFKRVAEPLTWVLHFFYGICGNYGIAIILLTVLVRACLLPFGRKQALNAQRMQELAPEMKKIAEKYKDDMEKRANAQRELFRKNNYNPLAGCLPMLFQLPIFIGLYRALSVDIELRQAPLIPGLRWCSNLASPDQLLRWDSFMPAFLGGETGFLGPYLNVLPLISVALMIVQQKMFTPPPQDEQQETQMKIMKVMMVFFGFLFFRVPSGLCLYFITSSFWGIAERKLIPKPKLKTTAPSPEGSTSKPALVSLKKKNPDRDAIMQERKKRQKQRKK